MSRRHSSSRRRNYGRRQHEVRERRSSPSGRTDLNSASSAADWPDSVDEQHQPPGAGDGYGAAHS